MTTLVAVGAQWGDEGKGKIVDWLAMRADLVVRFQGGNNAGHTLRRGRRGDRPARGAVGNPAPGHHQPDRSGRGRRPDILLEELDDSSRAAACCATPRACVVSGRAHVILDWHRPSTRPGRRRGGTGPSVPPGVASVPRLRGQGGAARHPRRGSPRSESLRENDRPARQGEELRADRGLPMGARRRGGV